MARHEIIQLVDDLDGSTGDDVTTVEFSLDGVELEVDLGDENAARLRAIVGEYVRGGARWTGGRRLRNKHAAFPPVEPALPLRPRTRRGKNEKKRAPATPTASAVREWALQAGIDVPARGRISAAVNEQYRAAHS